MQVLFRYIFWGSTIFLHFRSVYVTYYSDVKFRDLDAYRFSVPEEVFSADAPENQGFCWPMADKFYEDQPQVGTGWCLPSGMLDVSRCQVGKCLLFYRVYGRFMGTDNMYFRRAYRRYVTAIPLLSGRGERFSRRRIRCDRRVLYDFGYRAGKRPGFGPAFGKKLT